MLATRVFATGTEASGPAFFHGLHSVCIQHVSLPNRPSAIQELFTFLGSHAAEVPGVRRGSCAEAQRQFTDTPVPVASCWLRLRAGASLLTGLPGQEPVGVSSLSSV